MDDPAVMAGLMKAGLGFFIEDENSLARMAAGLVRAATLRDWAIYVLAGPTLTVLWAGSFNLETVNLLIPS